MKSHSVSVRKLFYNLFLILDIILCQKNLKIRLGMPLISIQFNICIIKKFIVTTSMDAFLSEDYQSRIILWGQNPLVKNGEIFMMQPILGLLCKGVVYSLHN